jgi:hypothetical protein
MIWLLANRGMSTQLLDEPHTATPIQGAHSLVYSPGVEPIRYAGNVSPQGPLGTYGRGLHRVSGFVFSFDGDAAEKLLRIEADIQLIVFYVAGRNEPRIRRFIDTVFVGDATISIPPLNVGVGELIGVPFKVNIPEDETLDDHIIDEVD